jgi:hypothetical protein
MGLNLEGSESLLVRRRESRPDPHGLRKKAKAAQGKWDPMTRAWYILFGKIKGTELERFIIA